jgi:hypothetical protein
MPDYFVLCPENKSIPATAAMPTTLRHLSGDAVTLTDVATGAESALAPGGSVTLTAAKFGRSIGANVSMTRSQ